MFSSKNKNTIGLDISDLSLKAVQLSGSGKKIKVQGLSKISLPKGIIDRGSIKDKQVLLNALNELFNKPLYGSFAAGQIVACLPETRSFIKLIEIEKGVNKLEDTIEAEMEKYIPMSPSEIYYDWQIIKEQSDNYNVLIGAAPKQIVNEYIDLIKNAKYRVSALEIEAQAICRSLLIDEAIKSENKTTSSCGIIDIGAKRTSLIVYSQNSIVFTLSIPLSGQEITERIASTLEISVDQAEKAKIICGLDKSNAKGIIHDILLDMIQDLAGKINDALEYCNSNYPGLPPISNLLICGGGANIKNLDAVLSDVTKIKIIKADPFINLAENKEDFGKHLKETLSLKAKKIKELNTGMSITQDISLSYTTAIGLALRNILLKK